MRYDVTSDIINTVKLTIQTLSTFKMLSLMLAITLFSEDVVIFLADSQPNNRKANVLQCITADSVKFILSHLSKIIFAKKVVFRHIINNGIQWSLSMKYNDKCVRNLTTC